MVVVLDDEDRENEGDLIMAADKVSKQAPPLRLCIHESPCTPRCKPSAIEPDRFIARPQHFMQEPSAVVRACNAGGLILRVNTAFSSYKSTLFR